MELLLFFHSAEVEQPEQDVALPVETSFDDIEPVSEQGTTRRFMSRRKINLGKGTVVVYNNAKCIKALQWI